MANYFRCDIESVATAGVGGRLYSGVHTAEIPNGVLCGLGALKTGELEIRAISAPKKDSEELYIVMKPEINYEDRYQRDRAFGIFRNPANKAVPVIKLGADDRIALSGDYFATLPTVGAELQVANNLVAGTQLVTYVDGKYKFVVTNVADSHLATYLHSDGNFFPAPYKMVELMIVRA